MERDRYLDLLRGLSIVAVVVGHWMLADLTYAGGQLQLSSSLGEVPAMWPLTWVFQVIPVFFFVAGAVNGPSWARAQARGTSYGRFVERRVRRVLVPTSVALLAIVTTAGVVAACGGLGVTAGGAMLLQPLWFLAVYLVLVALTPWTWTLHRRIGWRLVAVLLLLAVIVDVARLWGGLEPVADVNVLVVWLLVYVIGYWAADLGLSRRAAWALLVIGGTALVLLVWPGPYPARMVGVPGDRLSNMHPPTLAVLALGAVQIGALVLLRDRVGPLLHRPVVWAAVVWVNLSIMTMYLWHQFVLVALARLLLAAGAPQPGAGTLGWWLLRCGWVAAAGAALVVVAVLLGRFERLPPPNRTEGPGVASPGAVAVVVVLFAGLLALAGTRVTEPVAVQHPLGLPMSPVVALLLVLVAWLVLAAERRRPGAGPAALALGAALFLGLGVSYALGVGFLPASVPVGGTCVGLGVGLLVATGVVAVSQRHPPVTTQVSRAGAIERGPER